MSAAPVPVRRPRIASPGAQFAELAPTAVRAPHVITVTSGKGGVGKTNLTANIGWHLRQMRRRVLILDADLGLANMDIVLGLTPEFNLGHVLRGEKRLAEVIVRGPGGLRILPAGSGLYELTALSDTQRLHLLAELEALQAEFDYMLIDTGAGIASNVVFFNLAAQTMLVVVTPEPTSMTDAYALIKVLSRDYHQHRFTVVANDVRSDEEGLDVFQKLATVADRFLDVSLDYLGHVPHEPGLRRAVQMQRLLAETEPGCPASGAFRRLARRITEIDHDPLGGDLGILWRNILTSGPAQPAG